MFSAKRIAAIAIFLSLSLPLTSSVLAQETNSAARPPQRIQNIQGRLDTRLATKEANLENRLDSRTEKIDTRIATREANLQTRLAEYQTFMDKRVASQAAFMQKQRLMVAKMRQTFEQNMATREAALKAKLQTFKDQQKADLTQQISTNLNTVNAKVTTEMTIHLTQLSSVLTTIQNKATSSATLTANLQTAISTAQTAIQTAQTAVDAQTGKDYTVTVTSETAEKVDVTAKRDQLYSDLKAVQQLILTAKQSVVNAYLVFKPTTGVTNGQ